MIAGYFSFAKCIENRVFQPSFDIDFAKIVCNDDEGWRDFPSSVVSYQYMCHFNGRNKSTCFSQRFALCFGVHLQPLGELRHVIAWVKSANLAASSYCRWHKWKSLYFRLHGVLRSMNGESSPGIRKYGRIEHKFSVTMARQSTCANFGSYVEEEIYHTSFVLLPDIHLMHHLQQPFCEGSTRREWRNSRLESFRSYSAHRWLGTNWFKQRCIGTSCGRKLLQSAKHGRPWID